MHILQTIRSGQSTFPKKITIRIRSVSNFDPQFQLGEHGKGLSCSGIHYQRAHKSDNEIQVKKDRVTIYLQLSQNLLLNAAQFYLQSVSLPA